MKLYIDIEHFKSLATSVSNQNFANCIQILQHNSDIILTFSKQDLRNVGKKQVTSAVAMLITMLQKNRGVSKPIEENGTLPAFAASPGNYEEYTSVYFVDSPNIKSGLLHPAVGAEIDALTALYVDNRYIPTKQYYTPDMRDWSIIENDSTSCTDIVLTDKYLFSQSDIHYQQNAYNLICSLCKKSVGVKVNIVIFTLNQYKDTNGANQPIVFPSITRHIKQQVAAITGVEPSLTFVIVPLNQSHDRKIFTNYKSFSSGASYTYFEERSGVVHFVSHGSDIYTNSHADRGNLSNAQRFIEELQKIVTSVAGGLQTIIGDRQSNFLHFP